MEYPVLKTLYYKNRAEYERESAERPWSIAAKTLPLEIHGAPAYYINCSELSGLMAKCYEKARKLQKEIRLLPPVAYEFYQRSCLIDEVMLSNDLEGIRSTRKEIREIIDADAKTIDKSVRLYGMVKKYVRLLYNMDEIKLHSCADIRELYDELVANEIEKDDLPDGTFFRKGPVSVVTSTDKEKHKGVKPPEENIIAHMDKALSLLHDDSIPPLVGAALFHYFLGYIHPFYDGNGRLSRFISSCLLKRDLDELTALRLSYAIKERKSKYYDAFDMVNDQKNKGDATPFVLAFLEIIIAAEESLIGKIERGMERFHYFKESIVSLEASLKDDEKMKLIFVLIQNQLFGSEPLGIKELAAATKRSEVQVRKKLKEIIDWAGEKVIKVSKDGHRYVYAVDPDELDLLCQTEAKKQNR